MYGRSTFVDTRGSARVRTHACSNFEVRSVPWPFIYIYRFNPFSRAEPDRAKSRFLRLGHFPPMQAYRRAPDKVSRFARLQSCVRDNMKWGKLRNHPTAWEDFIFVFYVIHEDSHNLLRSRWIYASLNVDCSLVVIVPTPLLTETSRRVCVCVVGREHEGESPPAGPSLRLFSPSGGLTTSWCLSATFSFTYHLPPTPSWRTTLGVVSSVLTKPNHFRRLTDFWHQTSAGHLVRLIWTCLN